MYNIKGYGQSCAQCISASSQAGFAWDFRDSGVVKGMRSGSIVGLYLEGGDGNIPEVNSNGGFWWSRGGNKKL